MFLTTVRVRSHERGLWFRRGEFHRLLEPGTHRFVRSPLCPRRDRFRVVSTLPTRFRHAQLDAMLRHAHVRDSLHLVDLTDVERALVWKDERLAYVLGPGRHAFWKSPRRLYVETFRIDAPSGGARFEHPRLTVVLRHADAAEFLETVRVGAGENAVLYRDGVPADPLGEGLHVYWKGAGRLRWKAVDMRERDTEICAGEVLTAERAGVRVGVSVGWRVIDPAKALSAVTDFERALRTAARVAVRGVTAGIALDALLGDPDHLAEQVRRRLSEQAAAWGVAVGSVGVLDIAVLRSSGGAAPSLRPRRAPPDVPGAGMSELRVLVGASAAPEPA